MDHRRMVWFRLYSETIRDPKVRRLPPEHRWLWIALLCLASESPERGRLLIAPRLPATILDIQDAALLPIDLVDTGLRSLEEADMIARDEDGVWRVTAWERRQYASDSSTERVRRHRARAVAEAGNETLQKRSGNVPVTHQITDNRLTDPEIDLKPEDPVSTGSGSGSDCTLAGASVPSGRRRTTPAEAIQDEQRQIAKERAVRRNVLVKTYGELWVQEAMRIVAAKGITGRGGLVDLNYLTKLLAGWKARGFAPPDDRPWEQEDTNGTARPLARTLANGRGRYERAPEYDV
jgi:hypothetical protein